MIESTSPMSRPLRSTTTPASSGFTANTSRSASKRRDRYSMPPVSAVGTLPLATLEACDPGRRIDARLLPFRARAADQAHAAFTPGTTWPVIGTPARLHHQRTTRPLAFDATSILLTTPQQHTPSQGPAPGRRLLERLPGPHLTRQARLFPRSLTTTVFSQRSIRWFGARPRRPTLEGQQASISSTAPSLRRPSYIDLLLTFGTHGCRTTRAVVKGSQLPVAPTPAPSAICRAWSRNVRPHGRVSRPGFSSPDSPL